MSAGSSPRWPAAWRTAALPLLLLLAAVLVVYRDTGASMVAIWSRSDTFAHAFLVPPIALWLIWRRRANWLAETPRPAPLALLALAAAAAFWLAAELVAVNSAAQLAMTAMLVLAVPAVAGWRVAGGLLFPLVFLFFAVPLGEFLMPTLIGWTADFTVAALRLTGIPVYREGNQFTIPSGQWSVVDACSGVRYLIASFMVGTLFAYLNYRSTRRRVIFALVSIAVPIVANWLRAYMIVMLGHLSGNRLAVGVDHIIYGWVFFGIVIVSLFMIGARWSEDGDEAVAAAPAQPSATAAAGAAAPWLAAVAGLLLLLGPQLALWAVARGEAAGEPRLSLPAALAPGWQRVEPLFTDWRAAYDNPSVQDAAAYSDGRRSVGLQLIYYRHQVGSRKLVSSTNVLVKQDDRVWNQVASGARGADLPGGASTVRTADLWQNARPGDAARQRLRVWRLYWVNGSWTSSDTVAKLAGAWHRLRGQGDESAAVLLFAAETESGQADAALQDFLSVNLRTIESTLVATRDSR